MAPPRPGQLARAVALAEGRSDVILHPGHRRHRHAGSAARPPAAGCGSDRPGAQPHRRHRPEPAAAEYVTGDLFTGDGVVAAVDGAATVVHCAGARKGDEVDTRNLAAAAALAGVRHLVSSPSPGADRVPQASAVDRALFGYFGMKQAAELAVAGSGVPWTTLRHPVPRADAAGRQRRGRGPAGPADGRPARQLPGGPRAAPRGRPRAAAGPGRPRDPGRRQPGPRTWPAAAGPGTTSWPAGWSATAEHRRPRSRVAGCISWRPRLPTKHRARQAPGQSCEGRARCPQRRRAARACR